MTSDGGHSDEVRLALSLLAYSPGNLWRLALPERIGKVWILPKPWARPKKNSVLESLDA